MNICLDANLVTPQEVAQERENLQYFLNSWSYDPQRLGARIEYVRQKAQALKLTKKHGLINMCKAAQIRLYEDTISVQNDLRLRQAQSQQDAASYQQLNQTLQNMTPKTTYCNQIGTKTMCNTN